MVSARDWEIGGLDLSHAEMRRAQRVFGSCDFARGIAERDAGLEDWRIGGLEDWGVGLRGRREPRGAEGIGEL